MSEPFKLTPRLVAEKALPLLIEGKLGGQIHGAGGCYYRHPEDDAPCVLGAALPDAIARRLEAAGGGSFALLTDSKGAGDIVAADSAEDRTVLCCWQDHHDGGAFNILRAALEAELAKPAETA